MQDLKYGYRNLLRNPGFTAVAVLSLALGIGANTAIFSFINSVLLQDLPVGHPERLALFGDGKGRGVWGGTPDGPMTLFSWQEYRSFQANNKVFANVLAANSRGRSGVYLTIPGENSTGAPEFALSGLVSGNFFDVLGVKPAAGRLFDPGMDKAIGASPYIVLSDGFWERRFHRSASAIGTPIQIAGFSYTVIGVAPRGFFGIRLGEAPDVWIPLSMQSRMPGGFDELLTDPGMHFANLMGRLKTGVTLKQAQADIDVVYAQILQADLGSSPTPDDRENIRHARVNLAPGDKGLSAFRKTYEMPLRILMIVVAMVLLIACANVANLQLALAAKRQKEFALRFAIGAGRLRLVRQLLTESLLLAACGGVLGILLANGGGKLLVHLISTGPNTLPLDFSLDRRVLAFTALLSAATGLLFGLIPACRASRVDLNSSLKESKASMASPRKVTFGRALVAGQVAISLGLLVTAGLLLHSFSNLISLGAGFDRESVLIFKLDTDSSGYKMDARLGNLYRQIEDRVSRVPGVASEGVSLFSFNEGQTVLDFTAPGVNLPKALVTSVNYVSPGYFSALRIPLILGRTMSAADTEAAPRAGVVSEAFAKTVFGNAANALGRTFVLGDDSNKPVRVAGIVRDTKPVSVRDKDVKMVWLSVYQVPTFVRNLAVRVSGDPTQVAAAVRNTIHATERNLPIRWTTTLADEVSDSLVKERAIAQLSTFFAGLALLLSAVGLYGTISFAVARRTNEIGIRMALGAGRAGVLGMVLRDAMTLALFGMLIGLPLSMLAAREMQSMLYGLSDFDFPSILGSVAALSIVVSVAGYLPARRAASVDPMVALRYE
ncbi:MAG TPA: ABC transporter permease [Bryobacteraceae bacterium]|nr:ABC transporter permease [Bryobacteraceae bacterium]